MLTLGKLRGLQATSTARGLFAIMALDHRNNLRALLHPDAPDQTTTAEMVAFKQAVVGALAPASTAVLLDPVYGLGPCLASGALPGHTGLIAALEETGYEGQATARRTRILDGWSVEKVRRLGVNGAKLLTYYHPEAATAHEQEDLIGAIAEECRRHDLALFLEPLSYPLRAGAKKLEPAERENVVVETARRLSRLGIDVLKAEFPVDVKADPDEAHWAAACGRITEASAAPWVLLSASAPYEVFQRQMLVAAQAGASGVMVGRAVWQEAVGLAGEAREAFLRGEAQVRMRELADIVETYGRPWTSVRGLESAAPDEGWYRSY